MRATIKIPRRRIAQGLTRLLPAARSMTRQPERPAIEPGRVLARVVIDGQPVPWRAPIQGRGTSRTPAHVKRWKEHVARTIDAAGFGEARGIAPHAGPVEVRVYVCRQCPRGRKPGERWDARPDADNLFKGLGDALSGNVFKVAGRDPRTGKPIPPRLMPPSPIGRVIRDDNQVTDVVIRKRYATRALAWIEVVTVERIDRGPFPFPI